MFSSRKASCGIRSAVQFCSGQYDKFLTDDTTKKTPKTNTQSLDLPNLSLLLDGDQVLYTAS